MLKGDDKMNVAYCRVSTTGQSLDVQLEQVKAIDKDIKIFCEKQSGTSTAKREQLKQCLEYCREGDVLYITKLDRLARSMNDLTNILKDLERKKVGFKVLNNTALDTTSPTGRLVINILGSIAEFETQLRAERQAEGIKKAINNGVKFGKNPTLNIEQISELKQMRMVGNTIKSIAGQFNISTRSVYRYLNSEVIR
jgi:DNA invertase Pin-like site-specific DNA recombinase